MTIQELTKLFIRDVHLMEGHKRDMFMGMLTDSQRRRINEMLDYYGPDNSVIDLVDNVTLGNTLTWKSDVETRVIDTALIDGNIAMDVREAKQIIDALSKGDDAQRLYMDKFRLITEDLIQEAINDYDGQMPVIVITREDL